jgi:hypothetical protein
MDMASQKLKKNPYFGLRRFAGSMALESFDYKRVDWRWG